ncbi:unnamed protein product [Rotaria sordida]|uniref:Microbial-type PARG catalytic domain-containing protein n=1 Tax=Rotaria sordida TaxID=392033 RepID=A0A814VF47_9BILA|nr:unnamed protein product [Rotaria sordida]
MNENISSATVTRDHNDSEDVLCLRSLSRYQLATIAEDTLNKLKAGWYRPSNGPRISLAEDVAFSMENSVVYTEDDIIKKKKLILNIDETSPTSFAIATSSYPEIEVRHCTTLQAAQSLVAEIAEDRVGILNFASAKNPGGGFIKGSNAQEESLARSSSLYSIFTQTRIFNEFYDYNRRGKRGIYSHRIIYSPRVTIFKDDNGKLLSSPYHVGIVTVPAPNASVVRQTELVKSTMMERIRRLLYVFEANKHDTLVLGAFGCGVFKNNPLDVAIMFRQHLESDEFKNSFKRIIFAVLNEDMYQIFKEVFTSTDLSHIQHETMSIYLDDNNDEQRPYGNQKQQYKNRTKERRKRNNDFKQSYDKNYNDFHNYEDENE